MAERLSKEEVEEEEETILVDPAGSMMTYRFGIGSQSLVELLDGDFMIIDLELLLETVHILAAFLGAFFARHLLREMRND